MKSLTLAAVLTAAIAVAEPQAQQTPAQRTSTDAAAMSVSAGAIAQNPDAYFGKKVSVRAEVEDVLGRQTFLLDEDRLFAWPDLLVITPRLTGSVPEDEVVTVVGTVQRYAAATFRRDYDWDWWNDWDADLDVTFGDRPVIVADSVKTSQGTELVKK